jgi:D-3-phosphoglycerate dehydrogenase/C-terminal binding protein
MRIANRWDVVVLDAPRGNYVQDVEIEQEVLNGEGRVSLYRVTSAEEVIDRLEEADALIGWHLIPLPRGIVSRLRRCRGIVRASVGFDNIDLRCAADQGIPVCNVPDYGTEEVADHTLALLLALARRLRAVDASVRDGGWDWRAVGNAPRLRGLTLGIVGLGRIGGAVARRAQAFGMEVGFFDPHVPSGVEKVFGVTRYESLPDLLRGSRVVSLHVPLTGETRGLIGRAELGLLTDESILINTSRGEVIDQQALLAAVAAGAIGQLGLDVLSGEPRVPEALRTSGRVLLTAHSAFYSDAALAELRRKAAASARRLLLGEHERNVVNGIKRWTGFPVTDGSVKEDF